MINRIHFGNQTFSIFTDENGKSSVTLGFVKKLCSTCHLPDCESESCEEYCYITRRIVINKSIRALENMIMYHFLNNLDITNETYIKGIEGLYSEILS